MQEVEGPISVSNDHLIESKLAIWLYNLKVHRPDSHFIHLQGRNLPHNRRLVFRHMIKYLTKPWIHITHFLDVVSRGVNIQQEIVILHCLLYLVFLGRLSGCTQKLLFLGNWQLHVLWASWQRNDVLVVEGQVSLLLWLLYNMVELLLKAHANYCADVLKGGELRIWQRKKTWFIVLCNVLLNGEIVSCFG